MHVYHHIGALAADFAELPPRAARDMAELVRDNARAGARKAQAIAKGSAGSHGKHYPKSIDAESLTPLMWEYGPDAGMRQGGMSFEEGSRNQPPHNDIAKSYRAQQPYFRGRARRLPERWSL